LPRLNLPVSITSTKLIRFRIVVILAILSTVSCNFLPLNKEISARTILATGTPRPTFTPTVFVNYPAPIPRNNATALPAPIPEDNAPTLPTPMAIAESTEAIAALPTEQIVASPTPNLMTTEIATVVLVEPTLEVTLPALPTETAIPPTPTSPTSDKWILTSLKQFTEGDNSLIVTGEFVNNSDVTQRLSLITGDFFDETGTQIAGEEDTSDYWATDMVPPNGRLPFELTVYGINQAANFALYAQVEPISEVIFSDFQATNLEIYQELESYCIDGDVNFGDRLQDMVTILITGHNIENEIVGFGDNYFRIPDEAERTATFSICIDDTEPSSISQYSIQIWGR